MFCKLNFYFIIRCRNEDGNFVLKKTHQRLKLVIGFIEFSHLYTTLIYQISTGFHYSYKQTVIVV